MTNTFLLNDFYTVEKTSRFAEKIQATVLLNALHDIFKGHFEQMPVVPGVCQTQLIKELLQLQIGKNLVLTKSSNIKFMGMIMPTQHPTIEVEITYKQRDNTVEVDAKLFFESSVFTKFKGEFILV